MESKTVVEAKTLIEHLIKRGLSFYTGVPDSLLKDFCAYISENLPSNNHTIAANEGAAIALASGYHLATGKAGVVYMQNSGTGNAINPLLSLADPAVYSIPLLIIIGWRGEPGSHDEPQHKKQGQIQEALIKSLGYAYEILSDNLKTALVQIDRLVIEMNKNMTPVVLLVKKGGIGGNLQQCKKGSSFTLTREGAIKTILASISEDDRVVSTTGMASREIYELREAAAEGHSRDFLTVGSMGHVIMIALGLAKFQSRTVYCIDGDGSAIMHLGSFGIVANSAPQNLRHIVLNNGAHDSVGGQPTIGHALPFHQIAKDLGYRSSYYADNLKELESALKNLAVAEGPSFLEVRIKCGARRDLGRPKTTPIENKIAFMECL